MRKYNLTALVALTLMNNAGYGMDGDFSFPPPTPTLNSGSVEYDPALWSVDDKTLPELPIEPTADTGHSAPVPGEKRRREVGHDPSQRIPQFKDFTREKQALIRVRILDFYRGQEGFLTYRKYAEKVNKFYEKPTEENGWIACKVSQSVINALIKPLREEALAKKPELCLQVPGSPSLADDALPEPMETEHSEPQDTSRSYPPTDYSSWPAPQHPVVPYGVPYSGMLQQPRVPPVPYVGHSVPQAYPPFYGYSAPYVGPQDPYSLPPYSVVPGYYPPPPPYSVSPGHVPGPTEEREEEDEAAKVKYINFTTLPPDKKELVYAYIRQCYHAIDTSALPKKDIRSLINDKVLEHYSVRTPENGDIAFGNLDGGAIRYVINKMQAPMLHKPYF